ASGDYRNQLNVTFNGLKQAAESVDRLRSFALRLKTERVSKGASEGISELAKETIERMRAGLQDDLNTAQAQGAIFEMVRKANAAADAGQMRKDDVAPLLCAVEKFDEIFAVLKDDDQPKIQRVLDWAEMEGKV